MVRQRHGQIGKAPIDVSIPAVDFSLMAKAVGARGYIIKGPEDLEKLDFEEICSYPGPTVLDVRIDPDEISPLGVI
jgi:acetolactate synthase-1/2/3 large subunit